MGTAQLYAAGSEAQILLDRVSEEHGTEYFVSRGHKYHPQHLVFANMVTTMRYISAHKLHVEFDPHLLYPFPCILHIRSAGAAALLLSSTRDVASWADTWPFDQLHVDLQSR